MEINNIPHELIIIILGFINETESYKAARLTCKRWLSILKNVKRYNDNKLIEEIIFNEDNIKSYYQNNRIKREMKFNKYSYFDLKEYNLSGEMIHHVSLKNPYCLESYSITKTGFLKKKCDIRNDEIQKEYTPLFSCNIS